jgi:superfamily II DNA or RNA helicase
METPRVVLRDYQRQALSSVLAARDRGLHRVMVVLPTGCGKTTVFAALVEEFARVYNEPSLVVAHRQELLHQAAGRIQSVAPDLKVGIEGGDSHADEDSAVVVAGVQSIGRSGTKRLENFRPGLLILDEGHHAPASTWQNVMRRFGAYEGTCFTLAVTATDHRMDNKPLHGSEESIFEDVVFRYPLRTAVADGWLVDLRGYRVATNVDLSGVKKFQGDYSIGQLAKAVNTARRNETALNHWQEVASDRRTIVFCVDIQHAKDVAALFRDLGVSAEHIDGTMTRADREATMARFASGQTQVLANVEVATEGVDVPFADCVLLLRPTQSWALYMQMVGRGLRPLGGTVDPHETREARRKAIAQSQKPDCIVLDIVDVGEKVVIPEDEKPTEAVGLAGLVGMPADFDLEGQSVFDAANRFEELEPVRRAEMFKRPTSYEDLSTVLSEFDLLRELSIPEEVLGISRLAWMKVGDREYYLPCGASGMETDRMAKIRCDELGRYTLTLSSALMDYGEMPVGTDLETAFDEADHMVHTAFPDCGPIVRSNAQWRERKPTDRQVEALRQLGVDDATLALVKTAGQARALIEQRKMGRGVLRRR